MVPVNSEPSRCSCIIIITIKNNENPWGIKDHEGERNMRSSARADRDYGDLEYMYGVSTSQRGRVLETGCVG